MKLNLLIVAMICTIGGCASTIKLSDEGKKVRVLEPGEVESCRELGKTNTSVTAIVFGIERPKDAIRKELRVVARNSASRMGGDTIVPYTIIEKGQQTFVVTNVSTRTVSGLI